MSSTRLLGECETAPYTANISSSDLQTPTPRHQSTVSISILKFDKSRYFKGIRHSDVITESIYSKPYNYTKRAVKYCYYYLLCMSIFAIIGVVVYGGTQVVHLAINRDEYGHSFNINGTCLCLESIRTSYAWEQKWKIWNLTVCDGIKSKDYTFTSQSGKQWVEAGEIKPCYTNSHCTRIFTSTTTNVYIDEAIYLYVGAVLIFLIATCCCVGSTIYLYSLPKQLEIKNIMYFVGPKDVKNHYETQWNVTMTAKQRFDYWISHETRKMNIFLGSDSIYELLLRFYDDDNVENHQQNNNNILIPSDCSKK